MSDKKKIVWLFKTKRKVRDEYASSTIWNYGILEFPDIRIMESYNLIILELWDSRMLELWIMEF